MAGVNDDLLTIDALAQESGLTTRNIRAYQSRGLLPPPQVRGRTGYYGKEHIDRLALIREMQADGFNLAAIKRLIEGAGGEWEEMLGFKRAALSGWESEEPEVTTLEEIAERFGVDTDSDPEPLRRAIELGVFVPLGEGRFEVPSPALIRAGEEVVAAGVPLPATIEVLARIMRHVDAVARTFTQLFLDHVLRPFQERGAPAEEWPQVRESLERLQPVAGQAVSAAFGIQMTAAAEETYGRVLGGEDFDSGRGSGRGSGHPRSSGSRRRAHSGRRRRGAGA
ncbi:MAG: MerR family transcriptional regulator [Actinomycetota bacterium]|nr:MerR family transcriptional regulator [Actinomycetota bacterium]